MRNVLRVVRRDAKRILKAPAAWIVLLALIVLPSLYTWFNVYGFWNPYDNTANLRVCVVNEDAGAFDDRLGDLDLGAQVADALAENDQLGWVFTTREEAMLEVASGDAYAAIVIPAEFSANMATLLSDEFIQPKIEYYVNEKASPVAPKITDTGASTLDTLVNNEFVATASETIAARLDADAAAVEEGLAEGRSSALRKAADAGDAIETARTAFAALADDCSGAAQEVRSAKSALAGSKSQLDAVSGALSQSASLISTATSGVASFSLSIGGVLDEGSAALAQAAVDASAAIGETSAAISAAAGGTGAALGQARTVAQEADSAADLLDDFAASLPEGDAKEQAASLAERLREQSGQAQDAIGDLEAIAADMADASQAGAAAAQAVLDAATGSLSAADDVRATLSMQTIPAIGDGLGDVAQAANMLSVAVANQKLLIDQSTAALDELAATLDLSADALAQTDDLLASLESELDTLATDIAALGSASSLSGLFDGDGADPARIAEFMRSPTQVETVELYPLNAYGSAMAPLFINLTLWIGIFMLMVIMRMEVDDEEIPGLTVTQRFFGRFLLLCVPATLQAIVCCVGCIALGVQSMGVSAFVVTAIAASLAYLCVQYTLSTTLQHVGKGICVILVFVQIPGATGLYPIEMTPDFFQAVYPLFPFTYGINAIRETICGFYGSTWVESIRTLIFFGLAFLAIGGIARPWAANLNHLFARQIEESDIINIEPVLVPERRFRTWDLLQLMYERDEYRTEIERRGASFMAFYPRFMAAALVVGIVAPIVLTTGLHIAQADKVTVLTAWLVLLLVIVFALIVVEYLHESMRRRLVLEDLSEAEVRELYATRDRRFTRRRTRVGMDASAEASQVPEDVAEAEAMSEDAPLDADGPAADGGDGA